MLIVFQWEIGVGIYGRNTVAISEYLALLHVVGSGQFPCCLVCCFFSVDRVVAFKRP